MCESDAMAISLKQFRWKIMEYEYENRERTTNGIFLVIDGCSFKGALDKKELLKSMTV